MTHVEPQAERLQHLLDRLASGEPIDAVLGPEGDELAELAVLGAQLSATAPASAPARFRARLQADLQAEMATGAMRPVGRKRLRWVTRLTAVVAAVAMVVASAVVVSADSLPGQPLYGLKRAVEDTRVALTPDPVARAWLRVSLYETRLDEISRLVEQGTPVDPQVLDALIAAQARAAQEAVSSGDAALRGAVDDGAAAGAGLLDDLADRADPQAEALLRDTAGLLRGDDGSAATQPQPAAAPAEERPQVPSPATDSAEAPAAVVSVGTATPMPSATGRPTDLPDASATPTWVQATDTPAPPVVLPATEPPAPPRPQPTAPESPATAEPPTAVPEEPQPTEAPTLERSDQRAKTQTAEAQPRRNPTRRPQRTPGHGHVVPSPDPAARPPSGAEPPPATPVVEPPTPEPNGP